MNRIRRNEIQRYRRIALRLGRGEQVDLNEQVRKLDPKKITALIAKSAVAQAGLRKEVKIRILNSPYVSGRNEWPIAFFPTILTFRNNRVIEFAVTQTWNSPRIPEMPYPVFFNPPAKACRLRNIDQETLFEAVEDGKPIQTGGVYAGISKIAEHLRTVHNMVSIPKKEVIWARS